MRFPFLYLLLVLWLVPLGTNGQHRQLRDSLRRLIDTTRADTIRVKALSRLTEEALDTSYSLAMQYANAADNLAEEINWLPGKILGQNAIGYAYQGIDLPDSALRHFQAAYALALREPDKMYLKKCAFALSRFYTDGNRDSSLHYKKEMLTYAQLLRDTALEIYTQNELGGFYNSQKKYGQAIQCWQQAISLLRNTRRRNHEALVLDNIGFACMELKDFAAAHHCFFTALALAQQTTDLNIQASTHLALAGFYQQQKQPDSALFFAGAALRLCNTGSDIELMREAWQKLSDIYTYTGHSALALTAFKQYILYRDSVAHEERNAVDAKKILRASYTQQLTDIRRQQDILQATARLQYRLLIGAIAGLLLAGILAIVSYSALVKNRSKARTIAVQAALLQKQNQAIQASLSEKEVLMREIHHRVKNNLQVISALQQMQASRTHDPAVKAALADSQNRVLSIAFIHQNLYQHEDLKGVEMQSFVQELTGHVLDVCAHERTGIRVVQDIAPVTLDIDTAVPLGLIINELLTNSCKHAFRDRDAGRIIIHLQQDAPGAYMLAYEDDGPGLDTGIDFSRTDSLGLRLISQLAEQLDGILQYQRAPASRFTLTFKDFETRNTD